MDLTLFKGMMALIRFFVRSLNKQNRNMLKHSLLGYIYYTKEGLLISEYFSCFKVNFSRVEKHLICILLTEKFIHHLGRSVEIQYTMTYLFNIR